MRNDHPDHFQATLGIHTGSVTFARPSIGAWVSHGLGTVNRNLPSFVVLAPQMPYAGGQVWASDFLPGCHQGTPIVPGAEPIPNIRRRQPPAESQELEVGLAQACNTGKDAKGREHHAEVFTSWLAGGGVKGGFSYGESDDHGCGVAANEVHIHDFHATILHLLGLDHEKLTYRHAGRDFRLTDVAGRVVQEIIA